MLATICRLWENERDFRRLFEEQPALCPPHFSLLTEAAAKNMGKIATRFRQGGLRTMQVVFNRIA